MIVLGLSWIAHDEVRPERRLGFAGPNVGDAAKEAFTVAPTTHAAHQRRRDVLEAEVEVRHTGVADRVDERIGEVRRVQVQQTNPIDPVGDLLDERDDRTLPHSLVASVGRQVLGDEHDLTSL